MLSCEMYGERYILAHNLLKYITTLETDIMFQFSSINVAQNVMY